MSSAVVFFNILQSQHVDYLNQAGQNENEIQSWTGKLCKMSATQFEAADTARVVTRL